MSGFKRNSLEHNSEDLNDKESIEHHYREGKEVYVKKTKDKSVKRTTIASRGNTENRKTMDQQQVKRIRSQSGYSDSSHSLTLPGRGHNARSRAATLATSRDDILTAAKPYYVHGPKRQAPKPPPATKQQQKSTTLPRRRAPPPPPSNVLGKSHGMISQNEDMEESLYSLPDRSHHNRRLLSQKEPPPIPKTPRPSLAVLVKDSDSESIYEETTISYTTPVKESPSLPAPPLPPRSSLVQPPIPPRSCPPTFKPPPINPLSETVVPSSLHPPVPPLTSVFLPSDNEIQDLEVQEEYTDMLFNDEHVEDDEYILMDEAIKSRDLYKEQQLQGSQTPDAVLVPSDDEDTECNYMRMSGPTNVGYVKMMRDNLTKGMTTSKPPPIPPKPTSESGLTKRMVVPKQKMSFPHLPPPSPPQLYNTSSSLDEVNDTLYESIHQGEDLYY